MIGGDVLQFATQSTVRFYRRSVLNEQRTKETGQPCFDEVDYLMIKHPGERDCFDQPASESLRARYPKEWAAYSSGESQFAAGTALSELYPTNPSLVDELHGYGIHSIEQLAGATDTQCQNMIFGFQLRTAAQEFLKSSSSPNGQIEAQKRQIEEQGAQIRELTERLNELASLRSGQPSSPSAPRQRRRSGSGDTASPAPDAAA